MQHTLYSNIECFDNKLQYKRVFILQKYPKVLPVLVHVKVRIRGAGGGSAIVAIS